MNHRTQNHSGVQIKATPHLFHANVASTSNGNIQMAHNSALQVHERIIDVDSISEADLADRRAEIQRDDRLRFTLQEWESTQQKALVTVQHMKEVCFNAKNELYQLIGFYTVFQGVVFTAVAQGSLLTCKTSWCPSSLSLLVSIATIPALHDKLKDYSALKNNIFREVEVSEVITEKINMLKREGASFDFAKQFGMKSKSQCEERKRQLKSQSRKKLIVRWLTSLFLFVFSSIILSCCYIIPCWEFIERSSIEQIQSP